jgi:hypothetical protein
MTTTSVFQITPDYYSSVDKCEKNTVNTNPRYKYFRQKQFTCGDEEQFEQYRDDKNINLVEREIKISDKNIYKNEKIDIAPLYRNLEATNVLETFRYIFYKFKKGIFVKIVNNELKVFLPFSNVNFQNEWSHNIKINPKYHNKKYGRERTMYNFFNYITTQEGYNFYKNRINSNMSNWYGNNSLIRYEFPVSESDTNVANIKNMLEELCEKRKVPDIEFFINKRDFPILTKNFTEAYYNLFDSKDIPLVSHKYEKYVPILSMSKTDNYADILIPNYTDWSRVQIKENKWFSKCCVNNVEFDSSIKWENKKPTAVFRGSTTGCGVTIDTNPRLKVAYLSYIGSRVKGLDIPLIDAGITKWNFRPRKIMGKPYLETIDKDSLPFGLVDKLSPEEQSAYKYVIHIDGHVSAFRLSLELNMNSTILMVESEWKLWYSNLLKPYVHYIPIKKDLSDLVEKIKWCRKNDDQCKNIAQNAKIFYDKYIQKDGILDYLQKTLIDIKNETGSYIYNFIKPIEIQIENEENEINILDFPSSDYNLDKIYEIPSIETCSGLLKGVHYLLNLLNSNNLLPDKLNYETKLFENKLSIVNKYNIANFSIVVKNTSDIIKKREHIHETFISLKCINELTNEIPNFVYNFGMYKYKDSYNIMTQFADGVNLLEYISSSQFKFVDYLLITAQICLALQVAQNKFNFNHYDLTPWNIIIKKLDTPIVVEYVLDFNTIIKMKTNLIPVIIDYGKSSVSYNNMRYGYINMYKFSSCQDILSYLILTLFQIVIDKEKKFTNIDSQNIMTLANFISGNSYCKEKFTTFKEISTTFYFLKKYSHLVNSDKYELEDITPIDLFFFIHKNMCNFKIPFEYIKTFNWNLYKGDGKQVLNYIFSNSNEEKLKSFQIFFEDTKKFKPCNEYNFHNYFELQQKELSLYTVNEQLSSFMKTNNIEKNNVLLCLYKDCMKNLTKHFNDLIKSQELLKIDSDILNCKLFTFNENTFLQPHKIIDLLDDDILTFTDLNYLHFKNIIEMILVNSRFYKLKDKNRKSYIKDFSSILNNKSFNNQINIKTFLYITKVLCENNLDNINVDNISKNIQKYYDFYLSISSKIL